MDNAPAYAMQVSDLATSLAFFIKNFGFTLVEQKPAEDVAYVLDSDGDPLLLAGPATQDLPSYLSTPKYIAKPGESLGFGVDDLDALQAKLISKGVTDLQVTQNRLGDRTLHVKAPDYTFEFVQSAEHPFEELLSLYARSIDELDEALAGLSEAEMSLTLDENSWSIRQNVHHIADTDILFGQHMRVALSSPGTLMGQRVPIGNERYATAAEYRDRPVTSSVALFRAFHEHILDIVKYIPDAGERYIEYNDGHKHTCNQLVHLFVQHAGEHIDEIWAIRRKHGR